MPALIETVTGESWIKELKLRFPLDKTILTESEEAFTVLLQSNGNNNVLIGRYCRATQKGVVLDRRGSVRND